MRNYIYKKIYVTLCLFNKFFSWKNTKSNGLQDNRYTDTKRYCSESKRIKVWKLPCTSILLLIPNRYLQKSNGYLQPPYQWPANQVDTYKYMEPIQRLCSLKEVKHDVRFLNSKPAFLRSHFLLSRDPAFEWKTKNSKVIVILKAILPKVGV